MHTFLTVLVILASIVLVLVVLVQNSKGGGLSSNFSSSNQIMGAPKTADFLEKLTWGLAAAVIVLSLLSSKFFTTTSITNNLEAPVEAPKTELPDFGAPLPETSGSDATPQTPAQ